MKKETSLSRNRREFLKQVFIAGAASPLLFAQEQKQFRAAVIGHTRAGDYGHEMDVVFRGFPSVDMVAVADPVERGAKKAAERSGAKRTYTDYNVLLREEKPNIVVIASRWSQEHFAIGKAALSAGAHLFMEKPFTVDIREADELLRLAGEKKRKIAVAHQMRMHPTVVQLKRDLPNFIGELLQIHAHGKQDSRAGGEDLMVLGTHLFDLMRMFAGDAVACSSFVTYKGKPITKSDGRAVGEKIGLVAGDEIEAEFRFENNVHARFTSRGKLKATMGHWGMLLRGSKGTVRLLADVEPRIFVLEQGAWGKEEKVDKWKAYDPANLPQVSGSEAFHRANRRLAEDFIAAIQTGKEPECSGANAAKTIEMVMAVYESALAGGPVSIPLVNRNHPLKA